MIWVHKPHDHPFWFWKQCKHCNAAPEAEQLLVQALIFVVFFFLPIAYLFCKFLGAAVEVYK
jgi:hypothetical protein